jgi:hypothetical protein
MRAAAAREWAMVLGVFAALVAVCAVWLAFDRRPPEWDHANHLERAIVCARDLDTGDVERLLERSSFYPPLVICAAGAVYRFLPSDALGPQLVIWLFLGVGMVATYLLGRRLAGGLVGVVAAVLFGTAPFVVFSALRFQLDLPLAAMVALTLWIMLNTEFFMRPGWSLLAGVVVGLGMLTKPSFPVYVAPAVVVTLSRIPRPRAAANAAAAGLVALLFSLPWYGPRAFGMLAEVGARSGKQAAESGYPETFTWAALSLYPRWSIAEFGVLGVLLLAVGLVIAIRQRSALPVASVLVPFVLFSLIQNKNLRYVLPIVPAAAVVAALTFTRLRGRLRALAVVAVTLAAVLQVSATAAGIPRPPMLPGLDAPWLLASPPMHVDWRHREILALLARESHGAPAMVSVVPNDNFFSVSNFRYYAVRDGLPLRWSRAWDGHPIGVEYMITKTGDQGPAWTADKPNRIAARFADDPHLARVFPVLGEFPLPDGSVATVRGRRMTRYEAAPGVIAEAVEAAVRRHVPAVARDVDGLGVALEWDADIVRGRIRRLVITARAASLGEFRRRGAAALRVRDARLVVEDLIVNPGAAVVHGRLDLLDAARVRIDKATIHREDLATFLRAMPRFRQTTVELEQGTATVRFRRAGPELSARVRMLRADDRPFVFVAESAHIGKLRVPSALVNWVVRNYDPVPRLAARLPLRVQIGEVAVTPDAIRIQPSSEADRR